MVASDGLCARRLVQLNESLGLSIPLVGPAVNLQRNF